MAKPRFDIKQHVTDTIIAEIEAGTPPWRKPWTGDAPGVSLPLRHNAIAYRGINILMLWITAMDRGYTSNRWMTYRQALELGGCVRKGEKTTRTIFYGTFEQDDGANDDVAIDAKRQIGFAKTNNVFCADQIDGLPDAYYIRPDPPRDLGTESDPALDAFFANTGIKIITTDEPKAYYSIKKDHIHMPPIETFHSTAGYFGVLSHEAIHASGSEMRLGRLAHRKTSEDIAHEELIAEIGASMMAVHLGFDPAFDQSAAYVEGWLEAMRNDQSYIFKAAAEAQKAVDYLLEQAAKDERDAT